MSQLNILDKIANTVRRHPVITGCLLMPWLALYFFGLSHYPGSVFTYSLFSFVFLFLLISGLVERISYGYSFLTVMLFLGFWMKLTTHLWFNYPFKESTGIFDYSANSWDETLDIASYATLCIIATRIIWSAIGLKSRGSIFGESAKEMKILSVYSRWRLKLWLSLLAFSFCLALFNSTLGIFQIGLVPKSILIWPLNAVISYLIGHGLSIITSVFFWWEILLKKNIKYSIYFIMVIAFISTISVLSRGSYIFQTLPQFFAAFKNRKILTFSTKNVPLILIAFTTLLLLSNASVNALREHYYAGSSIPDKYKVEESSAPTTSLRLEKLICGVTSLLIDRWIGLEGLMTLQAHSEKSYELLIQGLQEHRKIGNETLYSSISKPTYYLVADKSKFQFTEIPGAIAFFFFSGEFWIVGLGMFVLTALLLASEAFVMKLTENPILCSLWGCLTANYFAQMGVAPKDGLFPIAVTALAIGLISLIQSNYFFKAMSAFHDIYNKRLTR